MAFRAAASRVTLWEPTLHCKTPLVDAVTRELDVTRCCSTRLQEYHVAGALSRRCCTFDARAVLAQLNAAAQQAERAAQQAEAKALAALTRRAPTRGRRTPSAALA